MPSSLSYNDKEHAYWLDGTRTKGVTSIAKIPDDTFALENWRKRNVVMGMALSPPLVERAAAHYDERDVLEAIAEEALVAAKAHEAAGRGSAAHRITERFDRGEMIVDTEYARQVQEAWQKALDLAGLVMQPQYVERVVVYPDAPLIAGTFDRLARRKFNGELVVVDLKTGAHGVKYPHAMAVQLALYANAPLLAGEIPAGGGTTTHFEPMPYVNRERGYIVSMPAGAESVEVHAIDIAAGWDAVQRVIFPTLEWRARRDLVKPFERAAVSPLTENIRGRLGIIKMVEGGPALMAARWPKGVPPRPPWNEDEGRLIVTEMTQVEFDLGVGF